MTGTSSWEFTYCSVTLPLNKPNQRGSIRCEIRKNLSIQLGDGIIGLETIVSSMKRRDDKVVQEIMKSSNRQCYIRD